MIFDYLQLLDSGENEHPVTVAITPTNKPLNRFANIIVCKSCILTYYTKTPP